MALIQLTQGFQTELDDEDLARVLDFNPKWFVLKSRQTFYACAKNTFLGAQDKPRSYLMSMHRLVMKCTNSFLEVDHKDLDGLHNKKDNLRIVTSALNKRNKRNYSNNTSGCPGVYPNYGRGRANWTAQITINKKQIFLGHFINLDDAINARKKAEQELGFHELDI